MAEPGGACQSDEAGLRGALAESGCRALPLLREQDGGDMAGGILGFFRRLLGFGPGGPGGIERQFGAIPWRTGADGIEFLLITSRRTGRWIFPKGGRMAWLSPSASAAQEAYEEAGVEGDISTRPAGVYRSIKRRDTGDDEIEVEMYPLQVRIELEDWPEREQRQRRWASLADALVLVSEPELEPMIEAIADQVAAPMDRGEDRGEDGEEDRE